ncbi:hypothetical protein [Aureispira sp. CCB-E]|uniref:hypothetical protein n=2 Tax=unclassified Aureispira TaxID=2649989 RepID=UPI0028688DC2|nr:hypothetical protein [Aureispira sp. CCB-E]WMX17162.1 hypothetical protein QP953_12330 [Aureispira sp. CCB-E]
MTSFAENPHNKQRKVQNYAIFNWSLNKTLEQKFEHKNFAHRFAWANRAFLGMGVIAQLASLTTAFTMLSYLFLNIHWVIRIACSIALVIMIEVIKRESTDDVMKGLFQYKEVERFSALLAIVAVGASIYISIEGAKILPSLLVEEATPQTPALKSSEGIVSDYDNRMAALEMQRDNFRNTRLYKGRLARKDSKVVQEYNEKIEATQAQKDVALAALLLENQVIEQKALEDFESRKSTMTLEREKLSTQLVRAAIGFELLFLLSMGFSWWYYTECEKEKKETAQNTETPINTGSTTAVLQQYYGEKPEEKAPQPHAAPSIQKIGFIDYEKQKKDPPKEEKIKKEYTRICPECGSGFIHKSHNHTYCKRSCLIAAREKKTNLLSNS